MFNPNKILVATDFSGESDEALREAMDIAEKYNARIYLLHVLRDVEQCAVDSCLEESQVIAEKNKLFEQARIEMDREIHRIAGNRSVPISEDIRFGNAAEEIFKEEREKGIDLVLLAPHAKRKHWWKVFPHLTDKVIRKSQVETMVVKH